MPMQSTTMRRRHVFLALCLAAILATAVGAALAAELPPGGTFVDDDGSIFEGDIEAIGGEGITRGCNPPTNNRFCPDRTVTRGQMAAFLVRALGLPPASSDYFVDDSGSVFEDDINRIADAGITRGCNPPLNDRFCPDRTVTRGQMAAFLVRAFGYTDDGGGNRFDDDDGSVFERDIDALSVAGVTKGCGPRRYCPSKGVTRAQMAAFLTRALGLTPIVPPPRPEGPWSTLCGTNPDQCPPAGAPEGNYPVPAAARALDTSSPDRVIGNGTPQSCTSAAVVDAVALGGVITFDCGPDPVLIEMDETAKIVNDTGPDIVIDGGGLVSLSGRGRVRILYMNTCDPDQVWTTSHCQDQDHPRLTVQNLTFIGGNATGEDPDGGGAIFVRGGRFKVVNSRFFNNACDGTGPDVGGGAIRVLSQYDGQPVYIVNSTFGGADGLGNVCSNGGALSSIGVSWTVINSLLTHNEAIGIGANPQRAGTPGGGNGGAVAYDGNTYTVEMLGTRVEDNHANEGGGGVFYVSNDRSGHLVIEDSTLRRNVSGRFENYPGIFYLGSGPPSFIDSTIE
jgi:hypothetical protein